MAQVKIDCMYEPCPIPLLKAARELSSLELGDVVLIETDHSCAIANITEWAEKEKLDCWIEETRSGDWNIYIKKT
ncbi:MAG: response regulator SirA [Gracilibacter sp. BRH_c7a]|nr:MAG: response regulator SirA [Gracilibacter sp. BRH_c7a]